MSEQGLVVAPAPTGLGRRTIAANILVAVAALVLIFMAAADGLMLRQWNFVARMVMIGVLVAVGWIPVALVIIAASLRPYWLTFIALSVVAGAILATLFIIWFVP
ncbi:hypothetical protein AB4Z18_02785 [Leifsonia sp. 2TAF2]|uniref:hypothetical protein n=1 Tax=Leifsonia sp. 2TAF2 TaxID=3233009 RepID=UPI003F9AF27D